MRRRGSVGSFFAGFFTGLFLMIILGLGAGYYLMQNPQKVIQSAGNIGAKKIVRKQMQKAMARTVNTIPKNYVALHQDEIVQKFQQVTTAYSMGTLTTDDIYMLYNDFFMIVGDGEIQPKEIDQILNKIDFVTQN